MTWEKVKTTWNKWCREKSETTWHKCREIAKTTWNKCFREIAKTTWNKCCRKSRKISVFAWSGKNSYNEYWKTCSLSRIKNPRATDFYSVPAETESTIQTLWSANHINKYHHCEMYTHSKSQFTRDFNLTKALLHLTELTFQDSSHYEIVKEGFNYRHGEFYLYKVNVDRIIGYSIEAEQFTQHIGTFYTYRPCDADQFNIVTAFPY